MLSPCARACLATSFPDAAPSRQYRKPLCPNKICAEIIRANSRLTLWGQPATRRSHHPVRVRV